MDSFPFSDWKYGYKRALSDSLSVNVPYYEQGFFFNDRSSVYSYDVAVQEGRILQLEVTTNTASHKILMEFFRIDSDTAYSLTVGPVTNLVIENFHMVLTNPESIRWSFNPK